MKYRKKPIVIEAVQWLGHNICDVIVFSNGAFDIKLYETAQIPDIIIKTLEGDMKVGFKDYIIKGVNGEFYPCKPDIFEKTYEVVE